MNPQSRSFSPRRFEGPRKVRGGIKLAGTLLQETDRNAAAPNTGPAYVQQKARQLVAIVESMIEPPNVAAGLEYAKSGQIVSINFATGVIEASVQGTAPRPYETELRVPSIPAEQWPAIIEAMAGEAVHVAKLLAAELPPALDDLLAAFGLKLLPTSASELTTACTCQQARCKHVAALTYVAAERLVANPLLVFSLLGMPAERLLEQLRQARTMQAHGVASAHGDTAPPESQLNSLPLEACIDEFWRSPMTPHDLESLEHRPPSHHIPHALLRRLGPSPMNGRFPLVGLLASVYDTVADAAKKLREG